MISDLDIPSIFILNEIDPSEKRVSIVPETASLLVKKGYQVHLEAGAGQDSGYSDSDYEAVGVKVVPQPHDLFKSPAIYIKINAPSEGSRNEFQLLPKGSTIISNIQPHGNSDTLKKMADAQWTTLAMNLVPRITRAQKMDSLSAMANIAGYRAVVTAAQHFGGFFSGQMTAAGRVPPAKILVIGAGVAGLSAIAASSGLGAIVRAFDTRPSVKEQVESLGGEFLEINIDESGEGQGGYAKEVSKEYHRAEVELFLEQAKEVDVVITTALIPGKPAPKLWTSEMISRMKPGSIIVDLASLQGGNCEETVSGEVVVKSGVTIIGSTQFTNDMPAIASRLYGNTVYQLLNHLTPDGKFQINLEDDITRAMTVTHGGEVTWPPPAPAVPTPSPITKRTEKKDALESKTPKKSKGKMLEPGKLNWIFLLGVMSLCALSLYLKFNLTSDSATTEALKLLMQRSIVFVLSCFVGWHIIWNVTPALHTPLMSVTNAISGIIIIGGLLYGAQLPFGLPVLLGMIAMFLAIINVSGGFVVTYRMLKMFRKQG